LLITHPFDLSGGKKKGIRRWVGETHALRGDSKSEQGRQRTGRRGLEKMENWLGR